MVAFFATVFVEFSKLHVLLENNLSSNVSFTSHELLKIANVNKRHFKSSLILNIPKEEY
jgi:hypothetical protein